MKNPTLTELFTSSSIFALSWRLGCGMGPAPGLFCLQSFAMWPAPPHEEQTMLFVTFGLSGHWKY